MAKIDKEKIRPVYEELIAYLSQAYPLKDRHDITDASSWTQLHSSIDALNTATGGDYSRFKVDVKPDNGFGHNYILNSEYRSKLNGLIMTLHAEFFKEDPAPFGGSPTAIFQQNQQQTTLNQIVLITEFQSVIDKQLFSSADLKEEERTFLEKLKAALPNIKSAVELISLVITIAKSLGLNISQVAHALGL